jgi:hypothetical protein
MLTQDQKEKLEPLTKHKSFGKLLIEAMKTWEIVDPRSGFGVDRWGSDDNLLKFWKLDSHNSGCCLLGASILGKDSTGSFIESVEKEFQINHGTAWELSDGFENCASVETEASLFGEQVSEIVFLKGEPIND